VACCIQETQGGSFYYETHKNTNHYTHYTFCGFRTELIKNVTLFATILFLTSLDKVKGGKNYIGFASDRTKCGKS
jgi:hypothetical protein